jgi:hypothetical protein
MRIILLTSLSLAVVASPLDAQQYGDECSFRRELSGTIDMAGARSLRVEAGAGSLTVRGVQGLTQARVRGTACASDAGILDALRVEARRDGSSGLVKTHFPDRDDGDDYQARIDLVIEVPLGQDANIADGSGSAEISGLGDVRISDGSGDLTITDVAGSLELSDGSGGISIARVGGSVTIADGSGEVEVEDVEGSVTVADGSGSVDVRNVRGDFVVDSDGSGSINFADIRGRIDIPQRGRRR